MYGRLVVLTSFALVLSTSFVAASTPEIRRWTDNSGKYSVDAELVEVKQDSVVLKKASGSVVIVPIARLGVADRQYLKSLAKPVAKKSITEGAGKSLISGRPHPAAAVERRESAIRPGRVLEGTASGGKRCSTLFGRLL